MIHLQEVLSDRRTLTDGSNEGQIEFAWCQTGRLQTTKERPRCLRHPDLASTAMHQGNDV